MSYHRLLPLFSLLAILVVLVAPVTQAVPSSPGVLLAEVGRDYVDLWWQPSEDASNYLVYRGTHAGNMVNVANVTAPVTAYHDGDLEDGSSFIYYVTSVDQEGESAPGPSIAATVPAKESADVLLPILAMVLSAIAIQVCVVMLLYLFKSKMRLQ